MELYIDRLHLSFFGHDECLHDVDLRLTGCGAHVLYGESGAGKTALLKCLAGLNAYTGSITLDGAPLAYGREGDVCMVFDDLALFRRRSLYYNLTYPLRLRKVPRDEWAERLRPHLEQWGLTKTLLDNPIYRTSRAIQVRVAMARAGLMPRKLLLLDNPLSGLGPDERRELFRTLQTVIHSYRGIVIYATDNIDEVRGLLSPTAVLSAGYLVAHGTPETLMTDLPCTYVAKHILPYWREVDAVAEQGTVHTVYGTWATNYPEVYEGKQVLAGLSPDSWLVTEADDGLYTVTDVLWTDGQYYSVLEADAQSIVVRGRMTKGARANALPTGKVPVYDQKTELRIDATQGE